MALGFSTNIRHRELVESIHARISIDPAVMMGKPCIKGTRITVELILRKLSGGWTFGDLLEAYPHLTEDDLRAALVFAADHMRGKKRAEWPTRARRLGTSRQRLTTCSG